MMNKEYYEELWAVKSQGRRIPAEPKGRVAAALRVTPACGSILDIGCGEGSFLLHHKGKHRMGICVDISIKALRSALDRNIMVVNSDLNHTLPFKDNSFDVITCLDVIEHLFNPRDILKECFRLLSKSGILILTTPNMRSFRRLFELILRGTFPRTSDDKEGFDGGHLHYFTHETLEGLLVESGFKEIGWEGIGVPLQARSISPRAIIWRLKNRRRVKVWRQFIIPYLSKTVRLFSKRLYLSLFSDGILMIARKSVV